MYENAFNSIERALRAEEGIANELDYGSVSEGKAVLGELSEVKDAFRRMQADLYANYNPVRTLPNPGVTK